MFISTAPPPAPPTSMFTMSGAVTAGEWTLPWGLSTLSSSLSPEDGVLGGRAGGGERTDVPCSSSVGELDVETCKVGEGVAAVMEAKVLVVHAGRLVRADVEVSGTLAAPPVADAGFSSLDAGRGRLLP